jgi:hypothetical protein
MFLGERDILEGRGGLLRRELDEFVDPDPTHRNAECWVLGAE